MKRIILSLVVLGLAGSVAVGATRAYFSDTETSTDNAFTAGTLNLTANDHDGIAVEHVTLTDLVPGWKGYDGNGVPNAGLKWKLTNVGSVPGNVTVEFANVHDNDNLCTEPEAAVPDNFCGDDQGELGANMWMATWKSSSGGSTGDWASGRHTFSSIYGSLWNLDGTVTLGAGESIYVGLLPDLGTSTPEITAIGNIIQTDSVLFDIVFHLDQVTTP